MNRAALTLALLVIACSPGAAPTTAEGIDTSWLVGCWSDDSGGYEHWIETEGGVAATRVVTLENGVEFMEALAITPNDGELIFTEEPRRQPPLSYPLLRQSPRHLLFQNLQSSASIAVSYTRQGDTLLLTRFEQLGHEGLTSRLTLGCHALDPVP